jgi:hypothetical protein
MKKDSLLFYAQSEDSLKKKIVDILTFRYPLTTNELHLIIKKELYIKVSYQAVHKGLRLLHKNGTIEMTDKKWRINKEWIERVSEEIERVREGYSLNKKTNQEFNILTIKNNSILDFQRENEIRRVLIDLVPVLAYAFSDHNIFKRNQEDVIKYLLEEQKNNEIHVLIIDNQVMGGADVVKEEESITHKFVRWHIKHFALKEGINVTKALNFIKEIESRLSKERKKIKIHIDFAETEKFYIKLFRLNDYKREATLNDVYRPNEKVYIYSKIIEKSVS